MKPLVVTLEMLDKANFRTRKTWNLAELQLAVALYENGITAVALAEQFERSEFAITRALRLLGVTLRGKGRAPSLNPQQKRHAIEMLKTKTQQQVADFFGIGRYPIHKLDAEEKRRNAKRQVH